MSGSSCAPLKPNYDVINDVISGFAKVVVEQISARQDEFKLTYSAFESVVCRAISKLRQSL